MMTDCPNAAPSLNKKGTALLYPLAAVSVNLGVPANHVT